MSNLDFDQLEKLIDGEERRTSRSHSREPAKRFRSRSRDRDRKSPSRRRSRSYSRDRSASPSRRSRRSGSGSRRARRYVSRTPSPVRHQRDEDARRARTIERERRDAEEKAKRQQDEAQRDEMTVLIMNLNLKAEEKDVWRFLTDNCGKVRDIHIVRDARSNKSKGVCYVEFYEQESVQMAYSISGQAYILGQPIRIQAAQAEKNRAAKLAKQQAQEILAVDGPMKVYVGGLVGKLATIEADELRQLFSPFGAISTLDFEMDPLTQKSRGYAFLTFIKSADARDAIQAMNGFEIAAQQIKVGHATEQPLAAGKIPTREPTSLEKAQQRLLDAQKAPQPGQFMEAVQSEEVTRLDDEENGGVLHGEAKLALMRKLARDRIAMPTAPDVSVFRPDVQVAMAAASSMGTGTGATSAITANTSVQGPGGVLGGVESKNFVLYPLFSKREVELEGKFLLDDIIEDVREELENIGAVQAVFIDQEVLDGKVYVRFVHREHAMAAAAKMQGRKYSGNIIELTWITDQAWIQITGQSL